MNISVVMSLILLSAALANLAGAESGRAVLLDFESEARGVRASVQVGFATGADGPPHAFAWRRTADSVIDLHARLPRGFTCSYAYGIDDEGSVGGEAMGTEWGEWHAIPWKVPVDAVRVSDFLPPLQGLRGDWTARYGR